MAFPRPIFSRSAILAGAVAAVLLALLQHGVVVGMFVVPLLPLAALAWAGFTQGLLSLSAATLTALLIGTVLIGPGEMMLILIFQLFPAWLFFRELLKMRFHSDGRVQWMPPGGAFAAVTLYACIFFTLLALFAPQTLSDMLVMLSTSWTQALSRMDPATQTVLHQEGDMSHLGMAFGVWILAGMCYAAACLGNLFVLAFRPSVRPSLALQPYMPPLGFFAAFLLTGGLSLTGGDGTLPRLGQMLSLILLLPYFISGLSFIHTALRRWQNPVLWLSGFYILIAATLWPALFIAAYGLARQCLMLLSARPAPR